jgi:hypothetical protein
MARKRMDGLEIFHPGDGELPEHVHAHVQGFYSQKTGPDMVVVVVEMAAFGGPDDGQVFRVALCPHCMLKMAECTDRLVEQYPEVFQE